MMVQALKESESFVWNSYNPKIKKRILAPENAGFFEKNTIAGDRYLAYGVEGDAQEGCLLSLYILFDKEDYEIVDAKFQVFGPTPLIAIADMVCELLIKKNVHQASKISADLVEMSLKEKAETFPQNFVEYINIAISAIDDALYDVPEEFFQKAQVKTPIHLQKNESTSIFSEFLALEKKAQIKIIQDVLDKEVMPYIALDDGGVSVIDVKNGSDY